MMLAFLVKTFLCLNRFIYVFFAASAIADFGLIFFAGLLTCSFRLMCVEIKIDEASAALLKL